MHRSPVAPPGCSPADPFAVDTIRSVDSSAMIDVGRGSGRTARSRSTPALRDIQTSTSRSRRSKSPPARVERFGDRVALSTDDLPNASIEDSSDVALAVGPFDYRLKATVSRGGCSSSRVLRKHARQLEAAHTRRSRIPEPPATHAVGKGPRRGFSPGPAGQPKRQSAAAVPDGRHWRRERPVRTVRFSRERDTREIGRD